MRPDIMMTRDAATGKVQCLACAHHCRLGEGQAGICGVRRVVHGDLQVPWGEVSGLALGPDGKEAAVSFSAGGTRLELWHVGLQFQLRLLSELALFAGRKDPLADARCSLAASNV